MPPTLFRKVTAPAAAKPPPPPADSDDSDSGSEDPWQAVSGKHVTPVAAADAPSEGAADESESEAFSFDTRPPPPPAAVQPFHRPASPLESEESESEESASPRAAQFSVHLRTPSHGSESTLEERIAQEWAFQAAMSGGADNSEHTHDPPPPDGTHLDRFGFIVAGAAVPLGAKEAALEASRLKKWVEMGATSLDPSAFAAFAAKHREKVKERVRKGIPNELRGTVWQRLSGSRELRLRNAGLFESLLASGVPSACEVDIIRDVSRTYPQVCRSPFLAIETLGVADDVPQHIRYSQRHGLGQQQLFRVLKAYSLYDSYTGYVQGMAYIAAILLMYLSEEESFWLLVALMKGAGGVEPLEGLFEPGMPLVQQCLFSLSGILKAASPKLAAHLAKQGAEPIMFATSWFVTLFSYTLPFDCVLRVWDCFMLEGMKVLFRVAATLITSQEAELLKLEFEELIPALKRAPLAGKASADALLKAACELKVSKKLEELQIEWDKRPPTTV